MEQNTYLETNSRLAGQEITHSLWNQKVHYPVHNTPHWTLIWTSCIQSTSSCPFPECWLH